MLPNREGRFKASIIEHGVAETGPNKLATFICKFGLTEELVNGQWEAFGPEDVGLEITGYFYLEKRDGSINTVTIDSLKAAFGWDGRDPMWLQDADFSRLTVQVKLEFELYEGRTRLKVRYVDAEDASPAGVVKADDSTRKSLNTRLGSKLRALAGGTPAPAAKPVGKPTAPPIKPAPAPMPTRPATMQEAWEAFCKACPEKFTQGEIEQQWFRALAIVLPGREVQTFTPAEWGVVLEKAPVQVIPF